MTDGNFPVFSSYVSLPEGDSKRARFPDAVKEVTSFIQRLEGLSGQLKWEVDRCLEVLVDDGRQVQLECVDANLALIMIILSVKPVPDLHHHAINCLAGFLNSVSVSGRDGVPGACVSSRLHEIEEACTSTEITSGYNFKRLKIILGQ